MSWLLLMTLSLIVFVNRYIFLEPRIALALPDLFQRMLRYSAPCLLTAICTPIVFYQGELFRALPNNPYFFSAIFCVVLACLSHRVLINLLLSLLCFYALNFLLKY